VIVGTPFLLHRGPSLKGDSQVDPGLAGPEEPGPEAPGLGVPGTV
jgi:hypothetical protein